MALKCCMFLNMIFWRYCRNQNGFKIFTKFCLSFRNDIWYDQISVRIPGSNHDSRLMLSFPLLRLLSSKTEGHKDFWKPSQTCHIGIH